MRYRPFGQSGAAVSCLSLALTARPMSRDARIALVYSALECGINTFELQALDPEAGLALGEALASLEREVVFAGLRLGWAVSRRGQRVRDLSPEGLAGAIEATLARTRLGFLDMAIVETVGGEVLPDHVVPALQAAQAAGRVRMLGIAGEAAVEPHIGQGVFEVLAAPFSVRSGWTERSRIQAAVASGMAVIGYGFKPFGRRAEDELALPPRSILDRLIGKARLRDVGAGPFTFLEDAAAGSAEEICLGYALTEPALATVQAPARSIGQIQALAAVVERELPAGVAAQIEMARFSNTALSGAA
jgi:aryl-alcohol dehydrogenase-like predicted oxidoreductase